MEDKFLLCAKSVIDAFNTDDDFAMQNYCKELNRLVCEFPADCTKTDRPFLVSVALFYALKNGYCFGGESIIHLTYFLMLKAYRSNDIHDSTAITLYAFLFVDANIGILLIDMKDDDDLETALGLLMMQLLVFFKTFEYSDYHVELDAKTMKVLKCRVDKWKGILRSMEKRGGSISQITSASHEIIDEYMLKRRDLWIYRQAHYRELFMEEYMNRL